MATSAYYKDIKVRSAIRNRFPWCDLGIEDARTLRRAAMTLHRWAELECGDSDDYANWCITRDEQTGKPFMERHDLRGLRVTRTPIRDREAGALRRVEAICLRYGLAYFHQADPRGPSLYIGEGLFAETDYTQGVAIA